ncbi:pre-mRNA 3'-end processing cleavage and polyadenylation factor [Encephalitozoon intestinalis ATCC 50506]|uniref:Pre-mRNA 3'-end processing cleavage and polyadenylation factor n=1 Tax=Encephalitozoon intestinalis (strain ATCC 50506) TaxID=876142 RepID=E0S5V1_ENCIT|nr:pre-mRNA 3'-end processing cleavage and polyadenylation factor [Encephalitozoon intestinalis ATCC 50506]ADM11086.1 pre-mRNA 3'-end processing cleavage and polyadenylation factor [Encephalitozoon intestinalis ATCC 50506]UTX44740.1 cleavage stimulation factor 77 [Encephalitozoon intestinalis]
MDVEEKTGIEMGSPSAIMEHARDLYTSKDYRSLESLFGKCLKKSYNLELWMLYIEYVRKVSQKKFKLYEVYEFTLGQFENYWDSYGLYKEYIEELGKIEDEQTRIEKIRNGYMRALQTPMSSLSELWKDFENFELELNKITGKKIVSDTLPIFQSSFQRYQQMQPLIRSWSVKNAAKLIDLEMENGMKLGGRTHESRMHFIYNYILDSFYYAEEAYFFYSEYLIGIGQKEKAKKVIQRGIEMSDGMFLSLYYGLVMDEEEVYGDLKKKYFYQENEDGGKSSGREADLLRINHLNYVLKKRGLESFRKLFIEVGNEGIGPHVFIYCAFVEYYATGSRTTPYNIFSSGLLKHPDSTLLKEQFFLFLLRIGDEENARALFKRLEKTSRMWDSMIEYEFMIGSMELFRELVDQKMSSIKDNAILPALPEREKDIQMEGILGRYHCFLNSFNFLDLKIKDNSRLLDEFMESLPKISQQNNVLSNLKPDKIVDLLKCIQ